MRILTVNYEHPPLGGGAGLISARIGEQLTVLGHEVTIITTRFGDLPLDSIEKGVRIIRLDAYRKQPYKSNVFEMLSWIKLTRRFALTYCLENKPDIIFAHFALPGGAVARFLNKKLQIPYVVMSHGHDIPWYFPRQMFFYHLVTWPWIHKICRKSVTNFVQTAYMKKNIDRFTGHKNAAKNMVVPNGCDTAMFPIVYPDKESTLKILYGGRLVAQKDPFTFLKSLLILKNAALSFQAIITGNGPLLTSMQDFAKDNHLADYIEFTGWQSKEQMPALYAQSHLFVLPSLAEGMSVAVLEALCSGLYVITTPVSGNTEMITEGINGKFVSLKNPEALANAILDFDQERKQEYPVKKEVVEQFRKMNDWAVVAQNYDEILNKVYRNI
ncbi:MAG: hypothetical protein CVU05_01345 [Bacteroidetes bacterium HGW-Bacteroidetes-21]|nr:MAG: hypothetical protein CVU05_01345 [Bacteroidetes bacterium HGW-Bacteroidetes-21]